MPASTRQTAFHTSGNNKSQLLRVTGDTSIQRWSLITKVQICKPKTSQKQRHALRLTDVDDHIVDPVVVVVVVVAGGVAVASQLKHIGVSQLSKY